MLWWHSGRWDHQSEFPRVLPSRRFFIQQLQGNAHKIWFSTGIYDREYPPAKILGLVKLFEGVRM